VVPKHSILMPLMALPAIAVCGAFGCLLTNLLFAIALVMGLSLLGGSTSASRVTSLVVFITSSWMLYCLNFSPDLLVAALIVWAYALAGRERWLACGFLAGLAVWAKVYAAIILLPLAIVIVPCGWRATLRAGIAALIGIAPMLIVNAMIYGGPLTTGYDRDGRVAADGFTVVEHYSLFNQPFLAGLMKVLFDLQAGMLRTAPLWFLWPIGFAITWRLREPFPRRMALALALGALANVAVFAPYEAWNQSVYGNRFLFPSVALGGALLTPIAARYFPRIN
jgi:hypothetical protein